MSKKINILVFLRILVGLIFVVSGAEKAIGPYQNFLYVIQEYEILPVSLERVVTHAFPWIELFLGIFLCLGLWLRYVIIGVMMMVATFITIVSQALIRDLPIVECGCFGELISFELHQVLMFDASLFVILSLLLWKFTLTAKFSLDQNFKE